jgi:hypothetical protein
MAMSAETYSEGLSDHQDGLLDIFVGLGILTFGIGVAADLAWLAVMCPLFITPLWRCCRGRIAPPRTKGVSLLQSEDVERRLEIAALTAVAAMALATLAGVALFWAFVTNHISLGLQTWLERYLLLVGGLAGSLVVGLVAVLSRMRRFFLYAVLMACVFAMGYKFSASAALSLASVGVMICLLGLMVLVRFLLTPPLPQINPGEHEPFSNEPLVELTSSDMGGGISE